MKLPPFQHGGGGGGHVGRSCRLRAVGRGARKEGPKLCAPRPLCPPPAKRGDLRSCRLQSRARASQMARFAKFALCGRHSAAPSTTLALSGRSDIRAAAALSCYMGLYLVGQISERQAALSSTAPPTHHKRCCSTSAKLCQGFGRKAPRRKRRP